MEVTEYKLTDVCDFQGGSQPPKKEWIKTPKEGYVRMLQIRDFTQRDKDNIEYVKDSKRLKKCKSDDVLIGRYGASVGKILTGLEGAYNVAIMKAIPNEKVLNKQYLLTLLRGPIFQNFIQNIGGRAAQAGFNKEDLSKYYLSLPSLDNQIRIAKVLSDCEALIAKRKESIILLDELLKSTFLEMFGDPVRNEKGWDCDTLENITHKDCPLTYGIVQPGQEYQGGLPVVRPVDLNDDFVNKTGLKFIDPEISKKYKRTVLKGGEILFVVRGTTGVVSIAKNELNGANVTRGIAPIWLKAGVNNRFVLHLIKSQPFQNLVAKKTYGIALKQINLRDLRVLPIIQPREDLQNKFTSIVENVEAIKKLYQAHLKELENLYGSLSQKAFKGELDVSKVLIRETRYFSRDPDETPEDLMKWAEEKLKEKESKSSGEEVELIESDDKTSPTAELIGKSEPKVKKWSEFSTEKIARLIKNRYSDKHFTLEMLQIFLENKKHIRTEYFTSEELKKKPALNSKQDLKKFIFSAIEPQDPKNPNPFLSLEQHFYDSIKESFVLKILSSDYKFFKEKDEKQRAGIYFSINK